MNTNKMNKNYKYKKYIKSIYIIFLWMNQKT